MTPGGPLTRVLLVAHGSDGDVLPFVRLGGVLRERGHDVTLLTHAPYRERVEAAGLDFVPVDTHDAFARYSADTALLPDGLGTLDWLSFYRRNHLFEQFAGECRALVARVVPGRTVLAGRHTSALSVLAARELTGAPAAWIAVAPIQPLAAEVARHLHQHVLGPGIDAVRGDLGLPRVPDWRAWFSSADLRLGLWPRWFDAAGPATGPAMRLTGFPLPDDDSADPVPAEAAELLDGTVRPVLITGGTGRMLRPGFHDAALAGCRRAGLPALLVAPHAESVPRPLPPHVRRFARLPFREVVPQVAAVLHHGGIGTLTRALAAGTPQVILAHGADRPDNAARLEKQGLARWLPEERWDAGEVAEALRAALRDGRHPPRTGPRDAADGLALAATHLERLLHGPARLGEPLTEEEQGGEARRRLAALPAERRRLVAARLRRPAGQEAS
ncbi:4'-demethylrebeccamycin synthase [Nonomuraea coxensis DSM 45129]|uniref:4'-demethylrebeccamycin synthase n=1 Tax=Nonomuraea coxensis DSM 45129 TaxID=1122611 RepID=A0ABX8U5A7_9ACTN|nr:nucleotide disphospho-sugar-binding domain-containing protein [Nonomuraea coxensis]QYC42891.1 4'-demethylrebeccamycin synthase [Nonomuraea coxensis DSM 45129]